MITRIEGASSKLRSVSRVGPDGHPSQKQKKVSFKNLCSVHEVTMTKTTLHGAEDGEGLVLLHDRLVGAAAEVKATTTSSRNRNNFTCWRRSGRWHQKQRRS